MYVLIVIGVLFTFVVIRGLQNHKTENEKRLEQYRATYGKRTRKTITEKRRKVLDRCLLERYGEDNDRVLDRITWNDLDMDGLFEVLDKCLSQEGEAHLFVSLHDLSLEKELLEHRGALIRRFDEDEELRLQCQDALGRIGFLGEYLLSDTLAYLTDHKEGGPWKDLLLDLLYLPGIVFLFIQPMVGLIWLLVCICCSIYTYFPRKKKLAAQVSGLSYVLRLSRESARLGTVLKEALEATENSKAFNEALNAFGYPAFLEGVKALSFVKNKGAYVLAAGKQEAGGLTGSGPLDVLFSYLNMLFHIDFIVYDLLQSKLKDKKPMVQALLELVGEIDLDIAVGSFRRSLASGYCEPVLDGAGKSFLMMEGGYHPLLQKPVANSLSMQHGILLTGSNASGKSTFLRTAALNAVMAQTLYTCSAISYRAPMFRIFSSIAIADNLRDGESYFMVEIKSLRRILDAAKEKGPILCFVDEVLRGTNTTERIAASTEILKAFAQKNILCIAATHDLELTLLLDGIYDNFHFEEEIIEGDVRFSYLLKEGPATTRNAIALLKQLGYEESITKAAEKLSSSLDGKCPEKVY